MKLDWKSIGPSPIHSDSTGQLQPAMLPPNTSARIIVFNDRYYLIAERVTDTETLQLQVHGNDVLRMRELAEHFVDVNAIDNIGPVLKGTTP